MPKRSQIPKIHTFRLRSSAPARSDRLFRAAWEHAADAMILSDATGVVIVANKAFLQLHGYSADEIIGHNFALIFPPERRAAVQQAYLNTFASATLLPSYETEIQRRDGSLRFVESRAEFISERGRRVALLSIVRDITERKALEKAYTDLLAREQKALAEAQRAIAVRDNFLSVASHELRTQLTILGGNAQLLYRRLSKSGTLTESDEQILNVLIEEALHLIDLIDNMLDLSLLEQGQISLHHMEINLSILVRQVVEHIAPALSQHMIVYTAPNVPLIISGDAGRLEQALQNLLQNAVKYSPQGGTVTVRAEQRGVCAAIIITDQGIGIPATALPELFAQFFRAPNTSRHKIPGSGIGLYVVKEIISMHAGTIDVTSIEGQGSAFTIELPLLPSDGAQ